MVMLYIYRCVMWRCVYGMRLCVDVQKKLSAAKITRRVMVMNVSHINIFKAPNLFLHWEYFQFIPPIFVSCF